MMNFRKISLIILLFCVFNVSLSYGLVQDQEKEILINEKEIDESICIENEIYIPLRVVFENLDFQVEWNNLDKSIEVKNDYLKTIYRIEESNVITNGVIFDNKESPKIIDSRTYIPLSLLANTANLQATIGEQTIEIKKNDDFENLKYITEKQKVTVLMYHHILSKKDKNENGWGENGAVNTLESFEEQLEYIDENNFNTITCCELEEFLYHKRPLPASENNNNILITFDDGYLSNYINAYPLMKKYNMHGVIFHVTCNTPEISVEKMNLKGLDRISQEQMEKMNDVFEHHLHTNSGHDKVNNVADMIWMDKDQIIEDLKICKSILPKSSLKDCFAYPFGMYDEETIEAIKEVGIKMAFTTKNGYTTVDSNPYELHRFGVFPWISEKRFEGYLNN